MLIVHQCRCHTHIFISTCILILAQHEGLSFHIKTHITYYSNKEEYVLGGRRGLPRVGFIASGSRYVAFTILLEISFLALTQQRMEDLLYILIMIRGGNLLFPITHHDLMYL